VPRKRRQPKIPTPSWESGSGTLGGRIRGRNPRVYATAGIVALVVVALAIVGFAFLSDYWADQRRPGSTALQVDDTRYTVRQFGDRLRILVREVGGPTSQNADPQITIPAVADQLVEETILFRFASEMEASASDAEIRNEMATRLGTTIDASELDALIEAELSRSGLSDEQYRDMIEAAVLRDKVLDRLGSELPDSVESIHYRQIRVGDQASADDIVKRIEEGEDWSGMA
jgi:parvulin-like peptidyl-prolyl isomerase